MMVLYTLSIYFYFLAIRIASLFNAKAKLLIIGQKNWKEKLEKAMLSFKDSPIIWVHCASVGEFEQGRPLIESIKQTYPNYKIILSFFSPSGYELHKNYAQADYITYLPFDTKSNASDFIKCSNPKAVIFIKYEFWLNYLFELNEKKIPAFLVSAVIKKHQPFFKWYGKPFVKALHTYKTIFVQDEHSLQLLGSLQATNGIICGDTRVDRVMSICSRFLELDALKEFAGTSKILIAGSTWPKDELLLLKTFAHLKNKYPNFKLIIVPHEVNEKNIERLEKEIKSQKNKINYSLYTSSKSFKDADLLIVNTIGILSSVYKYGYIAYIGGGFNSGIHNILEPAVYGLPVIFGPKHEKFNEANDLLILGGAIEITDEPSLLSAVEKYFNESTIRQSSSLACLNYVNTNKGATEKILKQIPFN